MLDIHRTINCNPLSFVKRGPVHQVKQNKAKVNEVLINSLNINCKEDTDNCVNSSNNIIGDDDNGRRQGVCLGEGERNCHTCPTTAVRPRKFCARPRGGEHRFLIFPISNIFQNNFHNGVGCYYHAHDGPLS